MSMHNDVSFVIDLRQNLYEHQSTWNPNLPLRFLFYISDVYSGMTKDSNLYGRKMIRIPTPKFIVFYNGTEKRPEKQLLRLSDSFTVRDETVCLELTAVVLNINPGYNEKIKDACKTLNDYSIYVNRVRNYARSMKIAAAVEQAISECIKEGILSEFLSKNRSEARKMSIYEYDEEQHMKWVKEEGFEEGIEQGIENTLQLTKLLLEEGKQEELLRATEDKVFREALLEKYNLK